MKIKLIIALIGLHILAIPASVYSQIEKRYAVRPGSLAAEIVMETSRTWKAYKKYA